MKILFYNYANYGYFFLEVMRLSLEKRMDIDWSAIILSEKFVRLYANLIGKEKTFYIHPELNIAMAENKIDLNIFKDYPESIYKSLLSDKGEGKLRRMSRESKLRYVCNIYSIYKKILEKEKPDFILFSCIESTDAVILFNLCKEKKIEPIIYEWARSFGVAYFSNSLSGEPPFYIRNFEPKYEIKRKAIEFINRFREDVKSPDYKSFDVKDIIKLKDSSAFTKTVRYIARVLTRKEKYNVSDKSFIGKTMTNWQPLCRFLRRTHDRITKRCFDVKALKELPDNFIYFPLPVVPEATTSIRATYFVDLLRAIDLVLENMPSIYYLVVKEHPGMAGIRSASFYRSLKKRAGVILADYSLDNIELIKKSACTIGVTGTSCLEAFLLGKQSMHLGKEFFTDWIYGLDSFYNFKSVIQETIDKKEVDLDKIMDLTAKILAHGYDINLFSPFDPGLEVGWVMNKRNVNKFLDAILDHIKKIKSI